MRRSQIIIAGLIVILATRDGRLLEGETMVFESTEAVQTGTVSEESEKLNTDIGLELYQSFGDINMDAMDEYSEFVEKQLAIIMSQPKTASDPVAYIDANVEAFQLIIDENEKSENKEILTYCVFQFMSQKADGLRGHVLLQLCEAMSGITVDRSYRTPYDWFELFIVQSPTEIDDFVYSGDDDFEKLIYGLEYENRFLDEKGFNIYVVQVVDVMEEGDFIKVVSMIHRIEYYLQQNILTLQQHLTVQTAATFKRYAQVGLEFVQYEQATGLSDTENFRDLCRSPLTSTFHIDVYTNLQNHLYSNDLSVIRSRTHVKNIQAHIEAHGYRGIYVNLEDRLYKLN